MNGREPLVKIERVNDWPEPLIADKSEVDTLKSELRIMANGVILNCKLCRIHGIGKSEGVCEKCPTLQIERMAIRYKGD